MPCADEGPRSRPDRLLGPSAQQPAGVQEAMPLIPFETALCLSSLGLGDLFGPHFSGLHVNQLLFIRSYPGLLCVCVCTHARPFSALGWVGTGLSVGH